MHKVSAGGGGGGECWKTERRDCLTFSSSVQTHTGGHLSHRFTCLHVSIHLCDNCEMRFWAPWLQEASGRHTHSHTHYISGLSSHPVPLAPCRCWTRPRTGTPRGYTEAKAHLEPWRFPERSLNSARCMYDKITRKVSLCRCLSVGKYQSMLLLAVLAVEKKNSVRSSTP